MSEIESRNFGVAHEAMPVRPTQLRAPGTVAIEMARRDVAAWYRRWQARLAVAERVVVQPEHRWGKR